MLHKLTIEHTTFRDLMLDHHHDTYNELTKVQHVIQRVGYMRCALSLVLTQQSGFARVHVDAKGGGTCGGCPPNVDTHAEWLCSVNNSWCMWDTFFTINMAL